jgi:hypothetical protein
MCVSLLETSGNKGGVMHQVEKKSLFHISLGIEDRFGSGATFRVIKFIA